MRIFNQPVELIIKTPSVPLKKGITSSTSVPMILKEAGIPIAGVTKSRSHVKKSLVAKNAFGTTSDTVLVKTKILDSEENPWDVAHRSRKAFGPGSPFVEPDFLQEFVVDRNVDVPFKKINEAKSHQNNLGFDPDWAPRKNLVWHLGDTFSQLKKAREKVLGKDHVIRIGHLDTGIDKKHLVLPPHIKKNPLQRNFVDGENVNDAQDPLLGGGLRNPGHGLATMAILAGTKVKLQTDAGMFNDYLGGAPFAEVVACRIASTVVLMKTSSFAEALTYLTNLTNSGTPVHVVSMSMGGAPARSWADAVNAAYEAGIVVVTAAGNNFNGLPTKHVIFPARFKRVIAACGVTHQFKPYSHTKLGEMQGCYGPPRHMTKALAAFTPNTPWAQAHSGKISFSGAGTSSATPQIAAAAAIYYREHFDKLQALKPWQRVEAIRNALYKSARKSDPNYQSFAGNGIVQAYDALNIDVSFGAMTPPDEVPFFPILTTLFKTKVARSTKIEMLNTELAQLTYHYRELDNLIGNGDEDFDNISSKKWHEFKEAVIEHPASSLTLKEYLIQTQTAKKIKLVREDSVKTKKKKR